MEKEPQLPKFTRIEVAPGISDEGDEIQINLFPNGKQYKTWLTNYSRTLAQFAGDNPADMVELSFLADHLGYFDNRKIAEGKARTLVNALNQRLKIETGFSLQVESPESAPKKKFVVIREVSDGIGHEIVENPQSLTFPEVAATAKSEINCAHPVEKKENPEWELTSESVKQIKNALNNAVGYLWSREIEGDINKRDLVAKLSNPELTEDDIDDDIDMKILTPIPNPKPRRSDLFKLSELVAWVTIYDNEFISNIVFKHESKIDRDFIDYLQKLANVEIKKDIEAREKNEV